MNKVIKNSRNELVVAHITDVYWRYYFYPKHKKSYPRYMRLMIPFINFVQFPLDYRILVELKKVE